METCLYSDFIAVFIPFGILTVHGGAAKLHSNVFSHLPSLRVVRCRSPIAAPAGTMYGLDFLLLTRVLQKNLKRSQGPHRF